MQKILAEYRMHCIDKDNASSSSIWPDWSNALRK